jgi:hypothetical protein
VNGSASGFALAGESIDYRGWHYRRDRFPQGDVSSECLAGPMLI